MKFVFIVNPAAGQKNSENSLMKALEERNDIDCEVYITTGVADATHFCKKYCKEHLQQETCFVACGGDGTINEVINGIYGFENACISVWPCGSGNDYVKYFGGKQRFLSIDRLIHGEKIKVDAMKVNGKYSLNVASLGFDCHALRAMEKVKRLPLLGGKNAYTTGVASAIVTGMKNQCKIIADGVALNPNGQYLLCTIANGQYVGGSYKCAPRSVIDDGYLEVCMVKPISIFNLIQLVGKYQKGLHLDDEKCKDFIVYCRAKKVELIAEKAFDVNLDGEIMTKEYFLIENYEKTVNFFIPSPLEK